MAHPGRGREYVAVGVGVVVRRAGAVLMAQRQNAHAPGVWGFPGGNFRVGESFEQCAARELGEETGLSAKQFRLLGLTNDRYPDGLHYITVFMEALGVDGEPRMTEPQFFATPWQWVPVEALPGNLFLPIVNLLAQDPFALGGAGRTV